VSRQDDFDVEPHQDNYVITHNFPFEDGFRQPYKPTTYVELWTPL
jgi:transcriptional regulator CtsR